MSKASELLKSLNESPGDGTQLTKIVLGKSTDASRVVSSANAGKFEAALKKAKIKYMVGKVDLSKSPYSGATVFGFSRKDEDAVDDILHDDLKMKNANPDSYDRDWSHAKL